MLMVIVQKYHKIQHILCSAGDLATAGRLRANTGKLVTLPKAARLILTTGVADECQGKRHQGYCQW